MDRPNLLNDGGEFKLDEKLVKELADQAIQREMQEQAQRLLLEAEEKPEEQSYFQRLDTKAIVKTDKEYAECVAQQVPMRVVRYRHALQILKETDARERNRLKAKKAKKVARASRKANRR